MRKKHTTDLVLNEKGVHDGSKNWGYHGTAKGDDLCRAPRSWFSERNNAAHREGTHCTYVQRGCDGYAGSDSIDGAVSDIVTHS